jgi:hypothetical protein
LKCRATETPQADRAVELWRTFISARREHRTGRERRFLRRAYARARDRAVPWRPSLH